MGRTCMSVYVESSTHSRLKHVSKDKRIPAAEIVRAGIELALEELEIGWWLWNDEGERLTTERRGR